MNKNKRRAVYDKYGGRCAYCGHAITFKEMQVDHIYPKSRPRGPEDAINRDKMDNLNPSCRMCNYYKRDMTLEEYRAHLGSLLTRVGRSYIYRMALRYGLVTERQHDGVFYYEEMETKDGH